MSRSDGRFLRIARNAFLLRRRRPLLEPGVQRIVQLHRRAARLSVHGSVWGPHLRRRRDAIDFDGAFFGRRRSGRFRELSREPPAVILLGGHLREIVRQSRKSRNLEANR